jgi:hypothetical protein
MIDFVPFMGIFLLVLIYVCFKYENMLLAVMFSSGLIILGVEILTNGISLLDNLLVFGLGTIYLFVGAYIWVAIMYDEFVAQGII